MERKGKKKFSKKSRVLLLEEYQRKSVLYVTKMFDNPELLQEVE